MLTKEQLTTLPCSIEKVEIGTGFVYVRAMKVRERDQWDRLVMRISEGAKGSDDQFRSALLVRTICDEKGQRLFEDSDIEAVGNIPSMEADKLYDVGARLSGITDQSVTDAKKN